MRCRGSIRVCKSELCARAGAGGQAGFIQLPHEFVAECRAQRGQRLRGQLFGPQFDQ